QRQNAAREPLPPDHDRSRAEPHHEALVEEESEGSTLELFNLTLDLARHALLCALRMRIYTIGHSTRQLDELIRLLREHGVKRLADIRRFPGSRRYPHFSRESLADSLPKAG